MNSLEPMKKNHNFSIDCVSGIKNLNMYSGFLCRVCGLIRVHDPFYGF